MDRLQSLNHSLQDINDSIRYMERRVTASPVGKTADVVLLRLCKAVHKLLEIAIENEH